MINRLLACLILLFGTKTSALAAPETIANHHEIVKRIDSQTKNVEIYWASPLYPNKKLPAIVYVHGVQDESRPGAVNLVKGGLLKLTADLGYIAAAISMPGYGQSSGYADFCGQESQIALQSALRYLRSRPGVEPQKIAVSGISCGAIVAAMVADKESLAAMILVSGVYDFEDMYSKWQTPQWKLQPEVMRYIQKSIATDGGLQNAAQHRSALPHAKQFKMPILLVAGAKDQIVDYKQSAGFFKAMQSNGHANQIALNPEAEHMISYESWARYAADFLHKSAAN